MLRLLTCIMCPQGCDITVEYEEQAAAAKACEAGEMTTGTGINAAGPAAGKIAADKVEAAPGTVEVLGRGEGEGSCRGTMAGPGRGTVEGSVGGTVAGSVAGAGEGSCSGTMAGPGRGTADDSVGGTAEGSVGGTVAADQVGKQEGDAVKARIIQVSGNRCPRGSAYVTQEIVNPMRNIATSVLVRGGTMPLASVRLTGPVPRGRIFDVMAEIRRISVTAPVNEGDVVIRDVLGLGRDVIITRPVEAASDMAC